MYNLCKHYDFPIVILVWEFTKSIVFYRKLFFYAVILMPLSVNTIVNSSSVAAGAGGLDPPIGLSTKMQNKKNTTF